MSNAPVDPANVPVFTGQLSVLDEKVKALSADGGALANAGSSVHTTFGGMSAYYQAPEAEQLFAVTKPVVDITMSFSGDMCTIAGALGTYAQEIRPLVKRMEELKAEAASFKSKVAGDEDWIEDGDLIDENLERRNKIAEVWTQFQAAERHAHDKIVALVCGTPLKVNDGSNGEGMYGYDAEALKHAKTLPWGDAVEESVPAWQVWEHAYDFGKGLIVDGVWGTIKGLGTLVGFDGWDAAGQAWTGLGKLATGLVIASVPGVSTVFWLADDKDLPPWIRDSRTAMKETGKALLAWDQWGSNPSRAAGAVTFNVLTTVFTGGAGGAAAGAGKAGLAAKAISLAGKAGRAIDPMTYVFKGAGAGVSKIGDVMAGLKGMGKIELPKIDEGAFSLPEGSLELPDGTIQLPKDTPIPEGAIKVSDDTIRLPEGTASLPPGTVKWPFDGPAKYADEAGNLYKEDGSLYQKADQARPEPSPKIDTGANTPRTEVPVRQETPVLAGVGARGGDDVIRLGSDISEPVHAVDNGAHGGPHGFDNTPTGRAGDHTTPGGHAPDGTPRNDLDHTPRGGHGDTPSTAVPHTDGPASAATHTDGPGGTGHTDGPGTGGGHADGPGTGGTHLPENPGASGLDDAARTGDDATRTGDGAADDAPVTREPVERPSFMQDGDNPYGPPGHLSDTQIEEIQVYRANEEPGYFDEFYKINGNRKSLDFTDASGTTPPQLTRVDENSPWILSKNAPAPPSPHYLDPKYIHQDPSSVADPSRLAGLRDATRKRFYSIWTDQLADTFKREAQDNHALHGTDDTAREMAEGREAYRQYHKAMIEETGAYGEYVAEHHYIAEHHPGAVKEPLHGPKNGNDQFDQVWRTADGRYVVVEAKSSVKTDLGGRNLPDGRRVSQGSQEYFQDIIAEMYERGKKVKSEKDLARALEKAAENGTLDYVLVKGDPNGLQYTGYQYQRFDISKGTLR
ncbi:hypothetical protein OG906_18315 [Streptomyces sp. NBC_01426]|uniref:hypothetical protein n=1 Tax=Streptomyces sp. NBC_01426 TaxID=2975866 RepID=UPI002E2F569C|nr:hypothetical protein [Streptomyces sp. NBC_01426]